jgi:hypothetical protein
MFYFPLPPYVEFSSVKITHMAQNKGSISIYGDQVIAFPHM